MGIQKVAAARGQGVDIRRLDFRVPAEASDPVVQIIDANHQNVWGARRSIQGRLRRSRQPDVQTEQRQTENKEIAFHDS